MDADVQLNLNEYITCKPEVLSKSKLCQPISEDGACASGKARSTGCVTDTEDLATVEPGTNVLLEGIIWNETTKGVLILNVNWRGRSYCGTLVSERSTCADIGIQM